MTRPQGNEPASTFTRQETIDKPGIIGARWWQQSIATQVPRRQAMTGLLALGGVMAAMAAIGTCAAVTVGGAVSGSGSGANGDVSFQPRGALEMQTEYGWSFGATGETLTFDGRSTQSFDRSALAQMAEELGPSSPQHAPFFVPTLFQSPTALPTSTITDESTTAPFAPLQDALVPILTPAMEVAFERGRALASLIANDARARDVAIIVDLPGPEAVAFAAGAANVLDPVFLFDNWPHPRGVVPAHLTLAAAAYYQPLFANARTARSASARPMFVLDRKRLSTYTDDASQFDNRHTARVPTSANLRALGTKNVVYVAPNAVDRLELDDLADAFLSYSSAPASIALRVLPATAFEQDPGATPSARPDAGTTTFEGPTYYGGSKSTHLTFWTHWSSVGTSDLATNELQKYSPKPRVTLFSAGAPPSPTAKGPKPTGFGTVPVAIAVGTGLVLGAKMSRSGSWNRSSSTSSGS